VFAPAFASWAGVAAWLAIARTEWYQGSAPDWARDTFDWAILAVSIFAAAGFAIVTLRSRVARHWFPLLLNVSTIYVAYVAIALEATRADVTEAIAEAEERLRETDARLRSLQERVERLRKEQATRRTIEHPASADRSRRR
jgi:cell division protein FtsB